MQEPKGFHDFVVARSPTLVRTGWLLTGDEASGQDLVQTALVKTWSKWEAVQRKEAPEAYVRRVMLSTFLSWRRRRSWTETPTDALPDSSVAVDAYRCADLRADLRAALSALPPRQRATLVLRFIDDLTESQTADALGCSIGTVKSQTFKALASLRGSAVLSDLEQERPHGH